MDVQVTDNTAEGRFEMPLGGDAYASAYYRMDGGRVVLVHTEVPFEFAGQGLATRLAAGTFGLIRRSGRKAVLKCPFMAKFFVGHPEYADIVDG
jgi:predicted GNAT family acetyltransferase